MPDKPVIFLMGPTASGKTGLAIELVERLPVEIISVDSAMVYKGMDIGTAKPSPEELQRAPHRLIDFVDPSDAYSAARFAADARKEIEAVHTAGRIPLLVGGTMLYFRALQQGLSLLPEADVAIREALTAQAQQLGWAAMHARLAAIDAEAAARIHPNDAQRIQRALEVVEITGSGPSAWHGQGRQVLPWRVAKLALSGGSREERRERIAIRFETMMAQGFLEEVRALYERGDLSPDCPALRAVGYRQLYRHLTGEWSLEQAVEKGITATHQLAKRQMTWLRSEAGLIWLDSESAPNIESVVAHLKGEEICL